jgi:truncated hemoglobin YjbI
VSGRGGGGSAAGGSEGVSLFDELGGEPVLRTVVSTFVDRMRSDPMIGFFFRSVDTRRIKDKEYELAAEHLGGPVAYSGRPLDVAHARHRIMGGQFARRVAILRRTLIEADVPPRVVDHWIEHTERLRPLITGDALGECNASDEKPPPGDETEGSPPDAGS